MIGEDVLDGVGKAVAVYHPRYYMQYIAKIDYDTKISWDETYPNWRKNVVVGIMLYHPCRPLSDKEISQAFDIPENFISDKLRDVVSRPEDFLALPIEAVDKNEKSESSS